MKALIPRLGHVPHALIGFLEHEADIVPRQRARIDTWLWAGTKIAKALTLRRESDVPMNFKLVALLCCSR
jgi:hypothetical protein